MDEVIEKKEESTLKAWFGAMRLRTLPLALASTLTGAFLAMQAHGLDGWVLGLTALTTVLLQVNSNLANDYGDFSKGTDNDSRIGPERALQSGAISEAEMRKAIWITSILSFASGVWLLYFAPLSWGWRAALLVFGVAAIYASIRYTAGNNPYGYRGLGDVAVMAFFGVLGVVGAYLCQAGAVDWAVLLPAMGIGAFSTGVLNVNNTRDIESDRASGKMTLAVKLGPEGARRYHLVLLSIGMVGFVAYGVLRFEEWNHWLFLMSYPLFLYNALKVVRTKDARQLDPMLKQLALSTFLLSLLLGLGLSL